MNKNENKYYNTAVLMDEALLELLNKKDIEYITIKEICEKAGVNRSTFYLHYETIDDLASEVLKYINTKFQEYFSESPADFIKEINNVPIEELYLINDKYLTPYLNFIKDNMKIYKATLNNHSAMKTSERYGGLQEHILIPILKRFNVKEEKHKYVINFYIQGVYGIISEWIKNDCKDDVDFIRNVIIGCINYNLNEE